MKQNPVNVIYKIQKKAKASYTQLIKKEITAGKRFNPEKHPSTARDFIAWNDKKDRSGNKYYTSAMCQVVKSSTLYAEYYMPHPVWAIISDVSEGVWTTASSTFNGTLNMVLHPIETVKGIFNAITHPREVVFAVKKGAENTFKDWCEGDLKTKSKIVGNIGSEVALFVIPASKVAKASKAAKATKAMNKTKAVGKFKKGTSISKIKEKIAKGLGKTISATDRAKINKWKRTPSDALYLKYKKIYDSRKYFNQKTGDVIYPGTNGNIHKNGFLKGKFKEKTLKKGQIIDRYGGEDGNFLSPVGTSFARRALPPFMKSAKLTKYEVLKPLKIKSGKIAPWFGQKGGGIQYLTDISVEELRKGKFIKEIK